VNSEEGKNSDLTSPQYQATSEDGVACLYLKSEDTSVRCNS